jgi:hypothetical protein
MSRSAACSVLVVLFCCTVVRAYSANKKDPIIIIAGADDVSRASNSSFPLGSVFSILSPTGTSPLNLLGGSPCVVLGIELPLCLFSNGTDFTWTSLTFSITPSPQSPPFTCLALGYFSNCSFSDQDTQVTFSGGSGLAAGDVFLFAVVGWDVNSTFAGEASGSDYYSGTLSRPVLPEAPAQRSQPSSAEIFRGGQVAVRNHHEMIPESDSAT